MSGRANAVVNGLQGALLLARGRPEGLGWVEDDLAGAARSFLAAPLCLPAFLCLRLIDWSSGGMPARPTHALALDLLSYIIGWAGFAVLSRTMAVALGRETRWPRFIAAWNWCNAVQYLLLTAAALPVLLGASAWFAQAAELIALGWALWIEWFAAKVALDVPGLQAGGMVALDLGLGLLLAAAVGS
jgi:hypothetical protein